jgi:UDP-N-acetylglucosamine acyltransferase
MSVHERMFDIPDGSGSTEVIIHPTATVEKGAELGAGVEVGAYSFIGKHVKLHDHVKVLRNVIVENDTTVGSQTVIYPFATIGAYPQDLKYTGERSILEIGKENSIRQYVNISLGTEAGDAKGLTKLGDSNLLMVYVHIGHDCIVGNNNVLANRCSLAGHVEVGSNAILGGHSAIHQFCKVGNMAIAAGGAKVVQDIAPYCLVQGDRASTQGLNIVGMKRSGMTRDDMKSLKEMYKMIFKKGLPLDDAIETIKTEITDSIHKDEWIKFIQSSERGLCR